MNCPKCDKPISDHDAGPETDACVAIVVMGSNEPVYAHSPHIDPIYTDDVYWVCYPDYEEGDKCGWKAIPFSTKIFQAWKVIEKMACDYGTEGHNGIAMIYENDKYYFEFPRPAWEEAETDSAPLSICRAALKALSR